MNTLPKQFNPWAFARNRQKISGSMLVNASDEVKKIACGNQEINYEIFGNLDDKLRCRISGKVKTVLMLQCQRCMEMMDWPIDCEFDYILIRHEAEEKEVNDGSETLLCSEDYLDIKWFIEEEILLVAPVIAKHKNCDLPVVEVVNESSDSVQPNPFASLKDLIKNKE